MADYSCILCDVSMNIENQAEIHCSGKMHKFAVQVYKEREEEVARLKEEMARMREELATVKEEKEEVEECLEEVEEDYRKSAAEGRMSKIILQHRRKARRELEEELDDERGGQAESQSLLNPGVPVELRDEVGLEPAVPRTRARTSAWAVVDTLRMRQK